MKDVSFRFIKWNLPVFICFTVIVYAVLNTVEKNNKLSTMERLGYQITQQAASALETWISDQIKIVKLIASSPYVISACKSPENAEIVNKAHDFLLSFHNRFGYYENIPIALKMPDNKTVEISVKGKVKNVGNGQFFTDTVKGNTIGKCGPHFSYIKAIYENKECFISEVYPSILRGNPIFVISAPVKDEKGNLIGVAVLAPQMTYFTDLFVKDTKVGQTGYMFFVDDRDMLISHPDTKLILNKNEIEKIRPISSQILKGKTEFKAEFDGTRKTFISQKIKIEDPA